MSSNSTIKWPTNTGIHLEEWVDFDNQVHKFYEPVYPGPFTDETFTAVSENDENREEPEKQQIKIEMLPY
ncbi:MAG: hypothetical protein JW749_09615 [Sedimentisphaerales bacterium]|nr:hypothetical protein [Sedimentisphaerales bacterium]